MRRREFLGALGGATVAWPLTARGQQAGKIRQVGFITGGSRAASSEILSGFPQGMRDLGYVEGRDFTIQWRYAEGKYERFGSFAAELVKLGVDVIVLGTAAAVRPVQQVSSTVPIVMGYSTDPVGSGFAASLASPGGNVTGLAGAADDTTPKQLELLATLVPKLTRVGLLTNPNNPNSAPVLARVQAAARAAQLSVTSAEALNVPEIENAFAVFSKQRVGAVVAAADALFMIERQRIVDLALHGQLASMFVQREYVEAGGLMSYGENLKDFFRRAASFVDKIFKGKKPSELPIEQPTKFHLVINRKTAELLGISIPSQLYMFADEVIE
jgi:putative ABC transport system substrate-binding protein